MVAQLSGLAQWGHCAERGQQLGEGSGGNNGERGPGTFQEWSDSWSCSYHLSGGDRGVLTRVQGGRAGKVEDGPVILTLEHPPSRPQEAPHDSP